MDGLARVNSLKVHSACLDTAGVIQWQIVICNGFNDRTQILSKNLSKTHRPNDG
jgi:hypothetical protein